jgi:hypothetical protein
MGDARAPLPIGSFYPDSGTPQAPADVAVVMPTVLRPQLRRAVASVYDQSFSGRVQLAIGVDVAEGDWAMLETLLAERPANVSALVIALPYSTSMRHGGVHAPMDGGSLRAVLSLAANSRHAAFLDDDNEWLPPHLERVLEAVQGKAWAFSHRMLVDEVTDADITRDIWDSVGVNKGRFAQIGGMVDPNCLVVDKVRLAERLGAWAQTPDGEPTVAADRLFFRHISREPHGVVEEATVRYRIRRVNIIHEYIKEGSNAPEAMRAAGERALARLERSRPHRERIAAEIRAKAQAAAAPQPQEPGS